MHELAALGCAGKHKGNMYRDFLRHVKVKCKMDVQPFEVDIPVRLPHSDTVVMEPHSILLPHEVFYWMARYPTEFDARVLGGSPQHSAAYWQSQRQQPWFEGHVAREAIDAGKCVAPLRIYGDDAEVRKGKSCLILTWSGSACRHVSTRMSRFLIAALPVDKTVENMRAHDLIYGHIVWSFTALLDGKFPLTDPDGEPWPPGSWRARQAGAPLDGRRACVGALAEFMGDWKWLRECLKLKRNYNCRLCCHLCLAQRDRAPFAYDFSLTAGWRGTMVSETSWRHEYGDLPDIARLPGFSLSMTLPDPMHTIHLGLCLVIIGSVLRVLIERDYFGTFQGRWEIRCRAALQAAFVRFSNYARRHKIKNSQQRFTPGMMHMTTMSSEFPEMKGKAFNAAVVTQWLNAELRTDPRTTPIESACMEGICGILGMMHSRTRTVRLTASEARRFLEFGQGHLITYARLSQQAQAANERLWPIKPKHHMFCHLVLRAHSTRTLPGWCFCDEDYNGVVLKAFRGSPSMRWLGCRIALSARLRLWRSTAGGKGVETSA